jgi:hypothetical protein
MTRKRNHPYPPFLPMAAGKVAAGKPGSCVALPPSAKRIATAKTQDAPPPEPTTDYRIVTKT